MKKFFNDFLSDPVKSGTLYEMGYHTIELDEYINVVVDYLENLRPDIIVERFASQSPKELLIAPDWGLKNYELVEKIKRRMRERDTWQGKFYSPVPKITIF